VTLSLLSDTSFQYLVAVLGNPDDVKRYTVECVGSFAIVGVHERGGFGVAGKIICNPIVL
jgi:hypothetical protein